MNIVTRKDNEGVKKDGPAARTQVGLLAIYSPFAPQHYFFPMQGSTLCLGRDELLAAGIHDEYTSKRHLRLDWDGHHFTVRDEGSTNGTFLNSRSVRAPLVAEAPALIRIGRTLLLCVNDETGLLLDPVRVESGVVVGAKMQALYRHIDLISESGESLLITGESGVGKELAARRFHNATSKPGAPFVAVNCATIPRELAERLLFGARRGAYSGAVADADGYIQAANGGTLFLDEVVELEPANQSKLLRVLERREVQALGATRPQRVELRICAAAQRDLRNEVTAGRFREDLYFRIGRPELRIPPLRERLEEIPWLIEGALRELSANLQKRRDGKLVLGANFVEACLLRPWPGNVRELRAEVRSAALRATQESATLLAPEHLGEQAGQLLQAAPVAPFIAASAPSSRPAASSPAPAVDVEADVCLEALRRASGNINRAAQELGMTRSKMRRLIDRHRIDIESMRRGS